MMARGRKSSGERFSKCRRLNFGPLTRLVVLGADDREGKDISKPARAASSRSCCANAVHLAQELADRIAPILCKEYSALL